MDTNGTKFMAQNRGLIYKRLHDKYTTMLWHAKGLQQMYDKMRFTKSRTTKLPQKLRQNLRHLISCHTTASHTHVVSISIFH